jgi:serine/threonine protein kinase
MTAAKPDNTLPINYKLGEYQIQAVLGHGGFGVTYLAKDSRLGSLVAIKEYFPQAFAIRGEQATIRPKTGANATDKEYYSWGLQEFLKEAQALAKFKHNHIVRVLRFLEANGTAYMVMEYEEGESLTQFLRKYGGLNEPTLIKVFLPILSGLQAVHEAGLLHLDIKPDNIYLRANGQPMLIDFGSARQVKSRNDPNQKVALTPGYSAIEHYPGKGELGPWTDIYSIGATLYRCITGKEPVDSMERYKSVVTRHFDPLVPAAKFERPLYSPYIRDCIDKATQIRPKDRPQSAATLQNGLMGKGLTDDRQTQHSAYGSGFIGIIKTVATVNRKRRGVPRSPLEKLFALLIFVATLAVVVPKIMVDTNKITKVELYDKIDTIQEKSVSLTRETGRFIDEHLFGKRRPPAVPSDTSSIAAIPRPQIIKMNSLAPFEPTKSLVHNLSGHTQPVVALAFLMDGAVLASASEDGATKLWNVETGEVLHTFRPKTRGPGTVAALPAGRLLALTDNDHSILLWDVQENKQIGRLAGHKETISALAFSVDGAHLVSAAEDKTVTLWDVPNRQSLRHLSEDKNTVLSLAFSPNGRLLVAGDDEGGIQHWDAATIKPLSYIPASDDMITSLAFSPKGKWLASGGNGNFLKLWYIGIDRNDRPFESVPDTVHAVLFSPDDKWMIVGGTTGSIEMRDLETGEVTHQFEGHERGVYAMALSPDGKWLASGGADNTVKIWK